MNNRQLVQIDDQRNHVGWVLKTFAPFFSFAFFAMIIYLLIIGER